MDREHSNPAHDATPRWPWRSPRATLAAWALALPLVAGALGAGEAVAQPRPGPAAPTAAARRPILVGLPQLEENRSGELVVEPNVRVGNGGPTAAPGPIGPAAGAPAAGSPAGVLAATGSPAGSSPPATGTVEGGDTSNPFRLVGDWFRRETPPADASGAAQGEVVPEGPRFSLDDVLDMEPNLTPLPLEELPAETLGEGEQTVAEPVFSEILAGAAAGRMKREPRWKRLLKGPAAYGCDPGIGRERVVYAPLFLDISQPLNNFRFRLDSAFGTPTPDKAEYFWAKSRAANGKGPPLVERNVDWQEFRILMETGGPKFSAGTELPFRSVDPELNNNTTGLGDVNVVTKLVLAEGRRVQLTQLFRTYINSGLSTRGLGTGHVSMEHGFLLRYQSTPLTFWHSELKFWFPIAGDPNHSGPVLQTGLGVSHVWYDSDAFAILPTLEIQHWTVLDGMVTQFPGTNAAPIDGMQIWNLAPGVRMVFDRTGEFGLFELGIGSSLGVTDNRLYDALLRFDVRFSF